MRHDADRGGQVDKAAPGNAKRTATAGGRDDAALYRLLDALTAARDGNFRKRLPMHSGGSSSTLHYTDAQTDATSAAFVKSSSWHTVWKWQIPLPRAKLQKCSSASRLTPVSAAKPGRLRTVTFTAVQRSWTKERTAP